MLWLSTPVEYRDQRNERAYCEHYHHSPNTLSKWKRQAGFWGEVQDLTKQFMADAVPETLVSLKEQARRGEFVTDEDMAAFFKRQGG